MDPIGGRTYMKINGDVLVECSGSVRSGIQFVGGGWLGRITSKEVFQILREDSDIIKWNGIEIERSEIYTAFLKLTKFDYLMDKNLYITHPIPNQIKENE